MAYERRADRNLQEGIRALKIDVKRVMADRIYDDKTPPSARAKKQQQRHDLLCDSSGEEEMGIPSEESFSKPITFFDYRGTIQHHQQNQAEPSINNQPGQQE